MPRYLFMLGSLIVLMLSMTTQAATTYLTNIRVIKIDNATRLIFSLTQAAQQHVFSLQHPDRLVIDLPHVRLGERLQNLPFPTTEVSSIRKGYPKIGILRLVLSLNAPMRFQLLQSEGNKQFTIDIFSPSTEARKIQHTAQKKMLPSHSVITIVIDAGHGGKDPGAVGIHGTQEKDVVLGIAKRLAILINKQPNMRAILTRNGDYFVPLRDRLRLARKGKADFFMSIHADSYFNTHASGISIYALSRRGATTEAARWLANRENTSELGGVDLGGLGDQSYLLRSVLIDLAQTATTTDSLHLGTTMLDALDDVAELHYRRVEQAPFVVLKSPDIPSVLVETGFISNADEELQLRNPNYQNKLAQALFNGVHAYLKKYPSVG